MVRFVCVYVCGVCVMCVGVYNMSDVCVSLCGWCLMCVVRFIFCGVSYIFYVCVR